MLTKRFVDDRYEREEAFHSLQVTVKNCKLEDSLEQFVNGEILEGDNAYFCEKCNERVSIGYTHTGDVWESWVSETREGRENCLPQGVRDTRGTRRGHFRSSFSLSRFDQLLNNFFMGSLH